MTAPAVDNRGFWIGGHWPDYATWHAEWCTQWAHIGWMRYVVGQLDRVQEQVALVRGVVKHQARALATVETWRRDGHLGDG